MKPRNMYLNYYIVGGSDWGSSNLMRWLFQRMQRTLILHKIVFFLNSSVLDPLVRQRTVRLRVARMHVMQFLMHSFPLPPPLPVLLVVNVLALN